MTIYYAIKCGDQYIVGTEPNEKYCSSAKAPTMGARYDHSEYKTVLSYEPAYFERLTAIGYLRVLMEVIMRLIDVAAFALEKRRLIPREAEEGKILDTLVGKALRAPGDIDVLDAQKKLSAARLAGQIREQAAKQIAKVQPAAGGGRKAPDDFFVHHVLKHRLRDCACRLTSFRRRA